MTSDEFKTRTARDGDCIIWTGVVLSTGYGQARYRSKAIGAHRLAWILANGPIPGGLSVLHRCDNRRCVKAEHLFLGTQSDNIRDASRKGRLWAQRNPSSCARFGSRNGNARLSIELVSEIRERATRERKTSLAKAFGVSLSTIKQIVAGKTWKATRAAHA